MEIILHRGAEGTGGNCIELVSGKSRILLDYGAPIGATGEETILNIPGLYDDKVSHPILGLLLSHTHLSHYGALLARPINPGIKVFMTEIMEDMTRINAKMPKKYIPLSGNTHYFRKGHKFILGRFVITPYLMDHTAAESFAFLIESDGKRVVYTGDFAPASWRSSVPAGSSPRRRRRSPGSRRGRSTSRRLARRPKERPRRGWRTASSARERSRLARARWTSC